MFEIFDDDNNKKIKLNKIKSRDYSLIFRNESFLLNFRLSILEK